MTRQKIILIVVIPLVAIGLLAGGFFLGKGRLFSKENANSQDSSGGGATNNVVPLGQEGSSDGSLSVTSAGAMDLGQLGENGAGGSQSGASGSSKSASPSDFKNYEKYKNEQHALFGDAVVGNGAELTANRKAAIYYKGWLTNGQLFDQTRTNASGQKEPLIFTLGAHEVVPGLEEGVAGMKVGGKRIVVIPPAVGYGDKANGPVPANSVMVFEIELVTVQ